MRPSNPCAGIHPKKAKTQIQEDICTLMFTATLFTRAKTWKQAKCPVIHGLRRSGIYIYNEIALIHKKE